MFFILFGTRSVTRDVKNEAPERRHCGRCGAISNLRHQTRRQYFTLFLIPIIPISKPESILTCNRCGASYYPYDQAFQNPPADQATPERTVLICPTCSGKMRIPVKRQNSIEVTCPHCDDKFTVSVTPSV